MKLAYLTTNSAPTARRPPSIGESLASVVFRLTCLFLFIAVVTCCRVAEAATADNGALWRPRFATPAIVALDLTANRQFTAEVRASAAATGWSLIISNDLKAWPCQLVSTTYSTINRGTEPGWQIKASVPPDTSPELFTLVASCSEIASVQNQSVSVVPSFTSDFYVLHMADEQIVQEFHNAPSGQWYTTVGTAEEFNWEREPINLINPRFVIATGDNVDYNGALDAYNNWANWGTLYGPSYSYQPSGNRYFTQPETSDIAAKLASLYLSYHKFRVPYVICPGNHDVPPTSKYLAAPSPPYVYWHSIGAAYYETNWGQRSWSFRMGDFYVLMHDWSESSLKTWATANYNASLNDSTIKYRLVGQHYTSDQAFMPTTCDLMLVGHGHTTATLQSSPYYIYEDGPAFSYGKCGFFNFRRVQNDWTCDQTASARNTATDVWPLYTDHGAVKKVRSNRADAMNITANSVTITNELPENFYDGRVRFLMSKGTYAVTNGTVLAQYDCLNNTKTAVLVKVNIPASGAITVSIGPGTTNSPAAPLDPQAFGCRMQLTFTGYNRGEPLTNFPVLVTFNPATPGFAYRQFASPSGADLRFADASGTNVIFHEIDEWNTNGISRVWVRIPFLASPTNTIWACWGNPAATNPPAYTTNGSVWSQDFELTWHLKDFADSTLRHPAFSPHPPAKTSTAFIGSGATFDGASYLDAGTVDLGNAFTWSAWINISSSATNIQTVWANKVAGWNSDGLALFVNSWNTADRSVRLETGNGTGGTSASTLGGVLTFGEWHLLTAVVDATTSPRTARLYVDGVDRTQANAVYSAFATTSDLQLGEMLNGSSPFHGSIDEARVETQARSSNWVWASYMTTASNAAFTTYSAISRQAPSLSLTPAPAGLTLTWPVTGVGFSLCTATNLTPPVLWAPVTISAALVNGQWQVVLPNDAAAARFYRLQSQ